MAINELFNEKHQGTVLEHQIQVRTFNVDKTKNMRSLNPEDIDQMITISGMLTYLYFCRIINFLFLLIQGLLQQGETFTYLTSPDLLVVPIPSEGGIAVMSV